MGAADVIPGVSGGTIAFISGIYEKLIKSLNNINLRSVKLLFTGRWKALEEQINISFLLTLILGVFIAAFSLAKFIQYLLHTYEEAVWAFFFGLIIASAVIMFDQVSKWDAKTICSLIIGVGFGYVVTKIPVIKTPDTLIYVYMSGVISIIAMILPGISGSFILLILDKYRYIIDVMSDISSGFKGMASGLVHVNFDQFIAEWQQTNFLPFIIFQLGTLTGILGFSKVLNWLFKKYRDVTIATLIGFMIGSLNKVWPWKNTLSTYTNSKGLEVPLLQENIIPKTFDKYFFVAIMLSIVGFFIVYFLEKISMQKRKV